MKILEYCVIKNGRPTWFYKKVLKSNPLGRAVFRFFFKIRMKRRNKEFNTMIRNLKLD